MNEMREFAKQSDDERIKSMMRRIEILTSKCARWNEALKWLEYKNSQLREQVKDAEKEGIEQ
jgi:membrane protein involved in colicin uptake